MPRYRCVERCFWLNQFWSPFPDGKQIYDGDEKPPESKPREGKSVKKYFVLIDPPPELAPVKADITVQAAPTVLEVPTNDAPLKDWMLERMNKHDLLSIMEKKYATPIKEDSITKAQLVSAILDKQKANDTNQDVANVLKG